MTTTICQAAHSATDFDGDGLTDGEEVLFLGTIPTRKDTDGDSIADNLEVAGFSFNSQQYYLDPTELDTNKDGLPDGLECPVWIPENSTYNASATCPDTDNDLIPNVFDEDNDNDGVPDKVDSSPDSTLTTTYSNATPLKITFNNLTLNKPVQLELEFRPTNPNNLTLIGHVLDWPTGDTQGQITRRLDTTFATSISPTLRSDPAVDPKAAYGDIRLVPMLEVTMPYQNGHYSNLPIKDTAPATRNPSTDIRQWLDTTDLNNYRIEVNHVSNTSNDLRAFVPLNTVAAVRGGETVAFKATMFYQPTQGTNNVVNWGADHEYRLVWLVQMLTEDCPVDVDSKAVARMNRENATRQANGQPQNYTLQDAYKALCKEVIRLINIYDDTWQLTGLQAKEAHGLEGAIMYEDPTRDTDLLVDDQLWMASWNLSGNWLVGRDCGDTVSTPHCNSSDGTRDVTISGAGTAATLPEALNAWSGNNHYLKVSTYGPYPHEDHMALVGTTQINSLLNAQFQSYTNQTHPTLLFLWENHNRSVSYGDNRVTATGNKITLDFNPQDVKVTTATMMNWVTYQYNSSTRKWGIYDLNNYLALLEQQIRSDTYFTTAGSKSPEEADGKRIWAQLYYMGLQEGIASTAQVDTTPLNSAATPDTTFVNGWAGGSAAVKGVANVLKVYLRGNWVGNATGSTLLPNLSKWWGEATGALSLGYKVDNLHSGLKTVKNYGKTIKANALVGMVLLLFVTAIALVVASAFANNPEMAKVAKTVLVVSALALTTLKVATIVNKLRVAAGGILNIFRTFSTLTTTIRGIMSGFTKASIVGLWLDLGVTIGLFIYLASTQTGFGGIQFNLLLANTIATIIVTVVLAILSAVSIVALIIVLLVGIFDLLVTLLGAKDAAITATIINTLSKIVYSVDNLVDNLNDPNRLKIDFTSATLRDNKTGFTTNNTLNLALDVKNTLRSDTFFANQVRKATFAYSIETQAKEKHANLNQNDIFNEWVVKQNRTLNSEIKCEGLGDDEECTVKITVITPTTIVDLSKQFVLTFDLAAAGSGINRSMSERYLIEAFNVPYRQCWALVYCTFKDMRDSASLNISQGLVYDILPATVDLFASLNWSAGSNPPFPPQVDFDGDGLLWTTEADPDDTQIDADNDGLIDPHDPNRMQADGDGDGLNDAEELRFNTSYHRSDSDGDGLSDYMEVKTGWLINYGSGSTRVWSDPNRTDTDGDGLTDLEESTLGLNPNVVQNPAIVDSLVAIDNIQVKEQKTPILFMPFDEAQGANKFSDDSGRDHHASCGSSHCPEVESNGRYGSSLKFNGVNQYAAIPHHADMNFDTTEDFTVALWLKADVTQPYSASFYNSIVEKWSDDPYGYPFVIRYISRGSNAGKLEVGRYQGTDGPTSTIIAPLDGASGNDGQWHHVAYLKKGNVLSLYVDGQLVNTRIDIANIIENNAPVYLGRGGYDARPAYFKGEIDQLAIFDHAVDDISGLMNGRYNLNDGLLRAGQTLAYQATVTNSATINATGYLLGQTNYLSPSVMVPTAVYHFDTADRRIIFANDNKAAATSSHIYCLADGTCPDLSVAGKYGNGVTFSQPTDVIYATGLASEQKPASNPFINFWLKANSLPSGNNRAYILDTESSGNGAVDLYLNSSGNLVIDIAGETNTFHTSTFSFGGNNLNTWHHVSLEIGKSSWSWLRISSGGTTNASFLGSTSHQAFLGAGTLGNNLSKTAALNGSLDELVVYAGGLGVQWDRQQIAAGTYTYPGQVAPDFVFKFEEINNYSGTYFVDNQGQVNTITCTSTAVCTTAIPDTSRGGDVAHFDGNDSLNISLGATAQQPYISLWVNPDVLPTSEVALFSTTGGNQFNLYLTPNGNIVAENYATGNASRQTSLATIAAGSWSQIEVRFERYHDFRGGGWRYDSLLSINGNLLRWNVDNGSNVSGWQVQIGPGKIGSNATGGANFQGKIDDLAIKTIDPFGAETLIISTDFEISSRTAQLSLINDITDRAEAVCSTLINCPSIDNSGKFGDAVQFDGVDILTVADNDSLDLNHLTLSLWVKPTQQKSEWQPLVTKQANNGQQRNYGLFIAPNSLNLHFNATHANCVDNNLVGAVDTTTGLTLNTWNHVAVTYGGTDVVIYINGNEAGRRAYNGAALCQNDHPLKIGNEVSAFTGFNGSLDELVILPTAVTREGVQALGGGTYPAILLDNPRQIVNLPARSTTTLNGTAQVATNALNSKHRLDVTAQAGFQSLSGSTLPVVVYTSIGGAVASLPFEETSGATSFETNANFTATCNFTTCPRVGEVGKFGRSLQFDGVDDHVVIADDNAIDFGPNQDFTVSVWLKADLAQANTSNSDNDIVEKWSGNGGYPYVIRYINSGPSAGSIVAARYDGSNSPGITASLDGSGGNDGQWHHVAFVKRGNVLVLYIDGMWRKSTTDTTVNSTTNNSPLYLGRRGDGNNHFKGNLDQLAIFNRALSDEEINDLYHGSTHPVMNLYMPFEEPVGSVNFDNIIHPQFDGTCNGSNCPTSALKGPINQAVFFDGGNDSIYVHCPTRCFNQVTVRAVAAWVNADRGTIFSSGPRRLDDPNPDNIVGVNYMEVTMDAIKVNDQVIKVGLPKNRWFHLVAMVDSNELIQVYVDGVPVASGTTSVRSSRTYADFPYTRGPMIGANYHGADFLHGYLDDLRVYKYPLSLTDIQSLHQNSAPQLHFTFDEASEATFFVDSSRHGNVGRPTMMLGNLLNPVPGVDGKLGNKASFNGSGTITVDPATAVKNLANGFSITAWVRPHDLTGQQQILSHARTHNNTGFGFGFNDNDSLMFRTWGVKDHTSTAVVQTGRWQHVAVVFDSHNTAKFYLDGQFVSSDVGVAPVTLNTADKLLIGGTTGIGNTALSQGYKGDLDELVVYGRELSTGEINAIYDSQKFLYHDRGSVILTVDNQGPSIALQTTATHWQKGLVQLEVRATDETAIVLMDFGLKAPGASTFTWQQAVTCNDFTLQYLNSYFVRCPWFNATQQGTYQVQFRAVDAVGNESLSQVYTIYVDDTAPTATSAYNNSWVTVTPDANNESWSIALTGSLADSGANSSGVDTNTTQVELIDTRTNVSLAGRQQATGTATTWSINYVASGLPPSNRFEVRVQVKDRVGNVTTSSVGTIRLDTRSPSVRLATQNLPTDNIIATSTTLTGWAYDQYEWRSAIAQFQFEEPSSATIFYDTAQNGNDTPLSTVACGTQCPTVMTAGVYGQALDFDGVDDQLQVAPTSRLLVSPKVSLAAWIQPQAIVANTAHRIITVGNDDAVLEIDTAGRLRFFLTLNGVVQQVRVPNVLTTNAWQHVAGTYDGQTLRLYHNGLEIDSLKVTGLLPNVATRRLLISSQTASFNGLIDEVLVYDSVLSVQQINALAQNNVSGVTSVEVWPEAASITNPNWRSAIAAFHFDQETSGATSFADSSGREQILGTAVARATCTNCPNLVTSGNYKQALSFDGTNDVLTMDNSAGLLDNTEMSWSVWIRPTSSGGLSFNPGIMGLRQNTTTRISLHIDGNNSSIKSWNNSSMVTYPITLVPNTWYHVVAVWNSAGETIYVNGTPLGTTAGRAIGAATRLPLSIGDAGSGTEHFTGEMDEVLLFDRALSSDEVTALAQGKPEMVLGTTGWLNQFGYNSSTAGWQAATLGQSGAALTSWQYALPTNNVEQFYQIHTRATDAHNNVSGQRIEWQGVIDTLAPRVTMSSQYVGSGASSETEFTLTIQETFLNAQTLVHPCANSSLSPRYHTVSIGVDQVSLTCRVDGHLTGTFTTTACDAAGNCTTKTVTPS